MRNVPCCVVAKWSVASALIASLLLVSPTRARNADPVPPVGARVTGEVRVVDGDTIVLAGIRVRLEGIDAPESGQTCPRRWLGDWACGTVATNALARMIEGRQVVCESRGPDKYNRMLGICFADGRDVNAAMVREGHAWAFVKYSRSYVREEAEARAAKLGIWQAPAQPAWEYRAQRWARVEHAVPVDGCAIKGNVTRGGRIYHMPWSPWYSQVTIDESQGKRWFCSEAEAVAAGWRPSGAR